MRAIPIQLSGRELKPHKAIISPLLGTRIVLTDSPWRFVSLWLKRKKKDDALFYWNQAQEFHIASLGMTIQSAPLLHYYSFMNAVKALLAAKSILFKEHHGVRAHNMRGPSSKISVSNEGVRILSQGILPALSTYLGETEPAQIHSLQELLFNLVYIHRTYCLTYQSQTDMFIPLTDCVYVADRNLGKAYFRANLSRDFASRRVINRLPPAIIADPDGSDVTAIRSSASVSFSNPLRPSSVDLSNLLALHKQIREDLHYINAAQTLWYAKSVVAGPRRLSRFPLTITLAAMHRLSEICRYRPLELASFLSGQKNWLLSEFIQRAPIQFFDEVASELTGHQFLLPNVRPAT